MSYPASNPAWAVVRFDTILSAQVLTLSGTVQISGSALLTAPATAAYAIHRQRKGIILFNANATSVTIWGDSAATIPLWVIAENQTLAIDAASSVNLWATGVTLSLAECQ